VSAEDAARETLSRTMTWALRHKAVELGLHIRPDAYVTLAELLATPRVARLGADAAAVAAAVAACPKQRFSLYTDDAGVAWVRANQGHSLPDGVIDPEQLLTRITDAAEAPVAVHGTYAEVLAPILAGGLRTMARHQVHFAAGEPGAAGVISGLRRSAQIGVYLDVAAALADGMVIHRSANNVILTSGFDGVIAPRYFAKVVRLADGTVLYPPPAAAAGGGGGGGGGGGAAGGGGGAAAAAPAPAPAAPPAVAPADPPAA